MAADPMSNVPQISAPDPVAAGNIGLILVGFLLVAVLGMLIYILMRMLQHKHKFRMRDRTNEVERVLDDKARIYTDKNGVQKIHLWKLKKNAPMPPSEAYSITNKGKYSLEAYYSYDKGFEYVFPTSRPFQISQEALTTNQKQFMIEEYEKAESKRKKRLGELVAQAAPWFAIVIIVVSMFIFWNDITAPSLKMADKMVESKKIDQKILESIQTIESEVQTPGPEDNSQKPPDDRQQDEEVPN